MRVKHGLDFAATCLCANYAYSFGEIIRNRQGRRLTQLVSPSLILDSNP